MAGALGWQHNLSLSAEPFLYTWRSVVGKTLSQQNLVFALWHMVVLTKPCGMGWAAGDGHMV